MPGIYRADHVGSLLRPDEVKQARASFNEGSINAEQLKEVEDNAVLAALERQKSIGIDVFTDGEYRRTGFQNDMVESVDGFISTGSPAVVRVWQGPGGEPEEQGTRQVVAAKLRKARRLTGNQAPFLMANGPGLVKVTVPSPNQFPAISFQAGITDQFYPTRSDLIRDLADIVKSEVAALADDGVAYIQLDAPRYSYYVDTKWREHLRGLGEDPDRMFMDAVAADNHCIDGVKREGLTVALHICRGNNESKWYAEGGYEPIAEQLFGSLDVDRFLLEYDTDRAGTFEPLRFVPPGKDVVLGLVSTKLAQIESQDDLLRRIEEASQYVPMERLSLSPQCGFASTAAGNLMTQDEQWRKLELVVETARKAWG
jgi:5-methyltetrahydropteroyltriglutamate--homocysteine methyltransferase